MVASVAALALAGHFGDQGIVSANLAACPILLRQYKRDSKEQHEVVRLFTEIGKLRGAEIRSGLEAYLYDRKASRGDVAQFKVYALNRFLFDIPRDAMAATTYFPGGSKELWPWTIDGPAYILTDELPGFMENFPKYDALSDFDHLRVAYGFRKTFGRL